MAKKEMSKINWKNLLIALGLIIIIVLLFTAGDYFVHHLSPDYAVPDYYFRNKIIFAIIWAFIAYLFVRKLGVFWKSLIISAFVAIILQTRYYLEGYPLKFVFEFMLFHFIILLVACLVIFYIAKKIKLEV